MGVGRCQVGAREDLLEVPEASVEDVLIAQARQSECVKGHHGGDEIQSIAAQVLGQPQPSLLTQELQISSSEPPHPCGRPSPEQLPGIYAKETGSPFGGMSL